MRRALNKWAPYIKYALIALSRRRRSSAMIMVSLALGITANTFIFSGFRAILNPKHFIEIQELVKIRESDGRGLLSSVSAPNFRDMKQQQRSLDAIAAYRERVFSISVNENQAEPVNGVLVSSDLFQVLKIKPIVGRILESEEFHVGGSRSVVISHSYWVSRFAAQREALGAKLMIDGIFYVVIGIMPNGFQFPWTADVWIPWIGLDTENRRGARYLQVVGRLLPTTTMQTAASELSSIIAGGIAMNDTRGSRERRNISVTSFEETMIGSRLRSSVTLLLFASGFVLLIACLNVSNSQSANAVYRQHEIATSLALGASRMDVIFQLLFESILLAIGGGLIGVLGSYFLIRYFTVSFDSILPYWMEIRLDEIALLYSLVLSILAGIISGVQPAFQSSRTPLRRLQEGISGSPKTAVWLKVLVSSQVAAACLLLISSNAAIEGLQDLEDRDLGFSVDKKMTVSIPFSSVRYSASENRSQVVRQVLERIEVLSGVHRAAAVYPMPLKDPIPTLALPQFDNIAGSPTTEQIWVDNYVCSPEYFEVMNTPILAGKRFDKVMNPASQHEVIFSRNLAHFYWGDNLYDSIGKSIEIGGRPHIVVGVVSDLFHLPISDQVRPAIYRAILANPPYTPSIVMQTDLSPETLQVSIESIVREYDAAQSISGVNSLANLRDGSLSRIKFTTYILRIFAILALILASNGIYGLVSSVVAWQTNELAIRQSLGSTRIGIFCLIIRRTLWLTVGGIAIGTALSYPVHSLLRNASYGIAEFPTMSFPSIWIAVLVTSFLSASIPAIRSVRVNPGEILCK